MTDKSKKSVVIVIVIVVAIVSIGVGAYCLLKYLDSKSDTESSEGFKVESNLQLDPDATVPPEMVSSINVNILKNIKIQKNDEGKYILTLDLKNGNDHQYMFTLSVDDKLIYQSGLIPAGMSLPEVELDKLDLEPGSYEAVMIFNVISETDNQTLLGSTGVQLNLDVLN